MCTKCARRNSLKGTLDLKNGAPPGRHDNPRYRMEPCEVDSATVQGSAHVGAIQGHGQATTTRVNVQAGHTQLAERSSWTHAVAANSRGRPDRASSQWLGNAGADHLNSGLRSSRWCASSALRMDLQFSDSSRSTRKPGAANGLERLSDQQTE
jgi:hypothetical protein